MLSVSNVLFVDIIKGKVELIHSDRFQSELKCKCYSYIMIW